MKRRFRFIVSMPRLADGVAAWQSALRRIEDRGYSTIAISDHFTQGWAMEPLVTLAAAAAETERVRLLTLVLGNDYRHPVLVHKAAATIDVISGGRLELGLGAGWMRAEYEAAGLAYDEPKTRRERLEESVAVIKGLFGADPLYLRRDALGAHVDHLMHVMRPPPEVRVHARDVRDLGRGSHDVHQVVDMGPESVASKVEWVRTGAR